MSSDQILVALENINKRLDALEVKQEAASNINNQRQSGTQANGLTASEEGAQQNGGPTVQNNVDSAPHHQPPDLRSFENIKDRLSKVTIPSNLKVQDSSAGIKQENKLALKILSKSARFTEVSLKQISVISARQEENGTFVLSEEDVSSLFTIAAAQIQFLQSEYASLVVKNTFDDETSRLFKSFENHSSAFSANSLQNLRIAADLASARSSRASFRGRSGASRSRGFRGPRGRGYTDWQSARRPPIDRPDGE